MLHNLRFQNRLPSKATFRPHLEILSDRTLPAVGLGSLAVDPGSFHSGRILVQFHSEELAAGLDGSLADMVSDAGSTIALVPGLRVLTLAEGVTVEDGLAAFQASPDVEFAEPDFAVSLLNTPNDPLYSSLWGLHNTGQSGGKPDADIDAPEAWAVTTGSGNTIVAVIDTGVDFLHHDLMPNIWTNDPEANGLPGIDDDSNGFVDDVHGYNFAYDIGNSMDDFGHGTHVAGTIGAAGNNTLGVAGINWNVQIMAVKVLNAAGLGFYSDVIAGIDYAVANGARISNNSYGGGYSQALCVAVANAGAKEHIFVASAGNDGANSALWPAACPSSNVISVAATDHNDQLASFSNYNRVTVDLGAPGVDILSTWTGNSYLQINGTSMASPHVAGVVALVRDLHPDWSMTQVVNQVLGSADKIAALDGKTVTGGRLNAAAALSTTSLLSVNNVSVVEGNNGGIVNATFIVTLSAASRQTVSVQYATANGSASSSSDYSAASGTLSFAPGETTKTITVAVKGDIVFEPNETFFVNLSNSTNAVIADSQGQGTIANDDSQPRMSINDVTLKEGRNGQVAFVFTISLSNPSYLPITVNFATADGTALAGSDYTATSGKLTFAPGETSKTITVWVTRDKFNESDENFFLNLSAPSNALLEDEQGMGTILNDDR